MEKFFIFGEFMMIFMYTSISSCQEYNIHHKNFSSTLFLAILFQLKDAIHSLAPATLIYSSAFVVGTKRMV
jgi:hypothetical protein